MGLLLHDEICNSKHFYHADGTTCSRPRLKLVHIWTICMLVDVLKIALIVTPKKVPGRYYFTFVLLFFLLFKKNKKNNMLCCLLSAEAANLRPAENAGGSPSRVRRIPGRTLFLFRWRKTAKGILTDMFFFSVFFCFFLNCQVGPARVRED